MGDDFVNTADRDISGTYEEDMKSPRKRVKVNPQNICLSKYRKPADTMSKQHDPSGNMR